jgi:hypothetical protein
MAFFRDRVFLGVTHHTGEGPEDVARILRFDPHARRWEVVYRSPLVEADARARAAHVYLVGRGRPRPGQVEAQQVPLYRGYRGMVVFRGVSDPEPALYVGTVSHWGARILRSADGLRFEPVCDPGLGDPNVLSFRSMVEFEGRLFVTPTGSVSGDVLDRNFGENTTMYVSDDPAMGRWQRAMPESFDNPDNRTIFGVAPFAGYLYAGTGNPKTGYQIWRTTASGAPPYSWECVLDRGAFRFNLNEVAISMVAFNDALYIGSGLPGLGYDKTHNVGPGAAELVRLHPDGRWDLIVGTPRFTPEGLKVPLASMGPGFNDPNNTVFWSLGAHEGALYLGTNNVRAWLVALRGLPRMSGGAQLWRTHDGSTWRPVTLDGFGNPFAAGFRSLLSTPYGLFVGTSNHQELHPLWLRRTRTPGEPAPGGTEIWLGRP